MARSDVVKNNTDTTIVIEDGTTPTALSFTFEFDNGDFSETKARRSKTVIKPRGTRKGVRTTEDQESSISFSFLLTEFTNAGAAVPMDVIDDAGAWAAAVSTAGPEYETEKTLKKVTVTKRGTFHDDSTDHVTIYNDVDLEYTWSESEADTVNVTGTVYGTITRTGATS